MDLRPKILIVDDRPENLVALETVLRDLDIDIVKALNGNEALKATLHNDFALALLDIQMPGMDGYELASILREEEKTAQLPFIFISAVYTDNLNVFKGYEKGAFSFITKPFQQEMLLNKVKFFIEKHQHEIALYRLNQDLEQKNEDLEYSNNELEAFTYSVSHDLRAPLRAMNNYAAMLREDYGDRLDEEGTRLLNVVRDNAVKMSKLIDSLLKFSRLGKKELRKSAIDMDALAREVVAQLEDTAANKRTRTHVHTLPAATGDYDLIRQVLMNLVSNAMKYSANKEKPEITVSASEKDGESVYSVKDNGAGFDMKYQNKLFGVFQRLHKEEEFEGIGIGLAIVKRIIHRHGGKVWAEAVPGEGATFYFSLPVEKKSKELGVGSLE